MIGTMQAAEAIKLLIGLEGGLSGKLLFVDALEMNFIRSDLCKDPTCHVCGPSPAGQKIEMGASAFLPSLK
jgi:molybdopterin/thiamine biosynthesis adenylyltransferase